MSSDEKRKKAPPGWYGDPLGRHERRFFDGSDWTDQVRDAAADSEDGPVHDLPEKKTGLDFAIDNHRMVLWTATAFVGGIVGLVLAIVKTTWTDAGWGALFLFLGLISLRQLVVPWARHNLESGKTSLPPSSGSP